MALLQSFLNGPMLIEPGSVGELRVLADAYADAGGLKAMVRSLANGFGLSAGRNDEIATTHNPDALCAAFGMGASDRSKPFAFADGIAVIPVTGSLLHRDMYSDAYATGYDYIAAKFDAAVADPDVKGIVFDVNSRGGHVMGCFELCDKIYEGRARKPSLAVVDGASYSAAYAVGSSASRMSVIPSAGVGSIGVVMMHASIEGLLDKNGIDINFIHSGKHKVDGNMFQALPEPVRNRYQALCDKSYDKFVALVARNRSLSADAVRGTQAECYDADEALPLGLIDAIQTPAEAVAAFRMELDSNTNPQQGATKMSNATEKGGDGNADAATEVDHTIDAAATSGADDAIADTPDPAATERARVKGITTCEEASGRETLAAHFAYDTDMSLDAARAALAAAPKAAAASTRTPFETAMDATANPNVGSGEGASADALDQSASDRILGAWAKATGNKIK
jgi:signal peptide peptidase SppA